MRFVDEAKIKVKAGDGGPGIVAWRREKFVPLGGPAGGDGGRGGDVIFVAKEGLSSLLDLKQQSLIRAQNGQKGQSKNKTGGHGNAKTVFVPVGTVIKENNGAFLVELLEHDKEVIICRGGDGGFGNAHFKSNYDSAPERSTAGFEGEEYDITLTLKLMADVGLLGFPNAGKSTFLSRVSNARPKVADYPFTTIKPMVGVSDVGQGCSMVIADIPGLIEGASLGMGLGFRFLRHLERVRILCHMLDASLEQSLIERYETINKELKNYSEELFLLPQLVAINKIDAVSPKELESIAEFESYLKERSVSSFRISAVSGQGIDELVKNLYRGVKKMAPKEEITAQKSSFDPTRNLYY